VFLEGLDRGVGEVVGLLDRLPVGPGLYLVGLGGVHHGADRHLVVGEGAAEGGELCGPFPGDDQVAEGVEPLGDGVDVLGEFRELVPGLGRTRALNASTSARWPGVEFPGEDLGLLGDDELFGDLGVLAVPSRLTARSTATAKPPAEYGEFLSQVSVSAAMSVPSCNPAVLCGVRSNRTTPAGP
jgi:hypothetical protein